MNEGSVNPYRSHNPANDCSGDGDFPEEEPCQGSLPEGKRLPEDTGEIIVEGQSTQGSIDGEDEKDASAS